MTTRIIQSFRTCSVQVIALGALVLLASPELTFAQSSFQRNSEAARAANEDAVASDQNNSNASPIVPPILVVEPLVQPATPPTGAIRPPVDAVRPDVQPPSPPVQPPSPPVQPGAATRLQNEHGTGR